METVNLLQVPSADAARLRQALRANRDEVLTQLYRQAFPMVRYYVQQHGGTAQEAKDVFQDALVVFYEKAIGGTLHLTATPSTYLLGVARNLWRQEQERRQRRPHTSLEEDHLQLADDEPELPSADVPVLEYVERLGEKCKSILLSFYYFQQPLEQIAATHAYRSVRSATVQKFKCLERLRNSVRNLLQETLHA